MSSGLQGSDFVPVFDVVIVGAGLAGLQAAAELARQQPSLSVVVLEAKTRIGGRVLSSTLLCNEPVELGAELVHGENTSLASLFRDKHWPMSQVFCWAQGDGGPDEEPVNGGIGMYWLGKSKRMLRYDDKDEDFNRLNDVIDTLPHVDTSTAQVIKVTDYLQKEGVTGEMLSLASAGYANTLCAPMSHLRLIDVITAERGWKSDGSNEYKAVQRGMSSVAKELARGVDVWHAWPVSQIDWSGPFIRLVNHDRIQCVGARRVIIATPVSILQSGLSISPAIPAEQMRAIMSIKMFPALKLLLRFKHRFWPASMHGIICADSLVPEFWPAYIAPDGKEAVLVAFACAEYAERITAMSRAALLRAVTSQLTAMFNLPPGHDASALLTGHILQDWGNEPWIKGGYSSPQGPGQWQTAATPLGDKVFFAGESFSDGGGTMHCAMDSGVRAAGEVIDSLRGGSKL